MNELEKEILAVCKLDEKNKEAANMTFIQSKIHKMKKELEKMMHISSQGKDYLARQSKVVERAILGEKIDKNSDAIQSGVLNEKFKKMSTVS